MLSYSEEDDSDDNELRSTLSSTSSGGNSDWDDDEEDETSEGFTTQKALTEKQKSKFYEKLTEGPKEDKQKPLKQKLKDYMESKIDRAVIEKVEKLDNNKYAKNSFFDD